MSSGKASKNGLLEFRNKLGNRLSANPGGPSKVIENREPERARMTPQYALPKTSRARRAAEFLSESFYFAGPL